MINSAQGTTASSWSSWPSTPCLCTPPCLLSSATHAVLQILQPMALWRARIPRRRLHAYQQIRCALFCLPLRPPILTTRSPRTDAGRRLRRHAKVAVHHAVLHRHPAAHLRWPLLDALLDRRGVRHRHNTTCSHDRARRRERVRHGRGPGIEQSKAPGCASASRVGCGFKFINLHPLANEVGVVYPTLLHSYFQDFITIWPEPSQVQFIKSDTSGLYSFNKGTKRDDSGGQDAMRYVQCVNQVPPK